MDKLVTLDHVSKHFHVGKGKNLVAVNDISLDIYKGETSAAWDHWTKRMWKIYIGKSSYGNLSGYQWKNALQWKAGKFKTHQRPL